MHEDPANLAFVFFDDVVENGEPVDGDILSAIGLVFDNTQIEFSMKMKLSERVKVISETARILLGSRQPHLVIELRKLAQPDLKNRPQFLKSWITATHATGDEDALSDALHELLELVRSAPHLRDFYVQMKRAHGRFFRFRRLHLVLG